MILPTREQVTALLISELKRTAGDAWAQVSGEAQARIISVAEHLAALEVAHMLRPLSEAEEQQLRAYLAAAASHTAAVIRIGYDALAEAAERVGRWLGAIGGQVLRQFGGDLAGAIGAIRP